MMKKRLMGALAIACMVSALLVSAALADDIVKLDTAHMQLEEQKAGLFTVFVPKDWSFSDEDRGWGHIDSENRVSYWLTFALRTPAQTVENDAQAQSYYEYATGRFQANYSELQYLDLQLDGHPARIISIHSFSKTGMELDMIANILIYVRNGQELRVTLNQWDDETYGYSERIKEEPAVLVPLVESIAYMKDMNEADFALSVTAAGKAACLTAGKSLKLTASYVNPDVKVLAGKNDFSWSVLDEEGKPSAVATVDQNGKVSAAKKADKATAAVVRVTSKTFGTSAEYRITVIPVIKSMTLSPNKATLYAGQEITLKAALKPAVWADGLVKWSVGKKDTATIRDNGDGTVTVKALEGGKITVIAKAEGDKTAKCTLTVNVPVENVEITGPDTGKAGAAVKLKAALTPAKPTNSKVQWSVDVDKNVAAISAKGELKIAKGAPSGTVITVTCKALGAAEECTAIKKITVQ